MNTLIYVEGGKGEGKSTLLRAIVREHAAEGFPFVVLDSTREWVPIRNVTVLPATIYSLEDAAHLAIEQQATLVVDEIDRWFSKTSNVRVLYPETSSIIHYGRHLNTALIAAARRPASVHNDLLELADTIFLFHHAGVASCSWVRELLGSPVAEQVQRLQPGQFVRVDY